MAGHPGKVAPSLSSLLVGRGVTLAGKRVAWTWNDGPLPGVVVRVHGPAIRGRIALVGA